MSDKLTKEQRAFQAVARKGDLRAAVELARGVVRRVIWKEGIDVDPIDISAELAGPIKAEQISYEYTCNYAYAALAIGIAIGQTVSRDMFDGGAR